MTWNAYFLLVLLTYLSYVGPEAKLAGAGKSSSLQFLDIFHLPRVRKQKIESSQFEAPPEHF